MSLQVECPDCRALMWPGGRCPWDNGAGCRGRSLTIIKARPVRLHAEAVRRPRTERPAKVAPERTRRVKSAARPQRVRLSAQEAHARKVARSDAWNKAHRPPRALGTCVMCPNTYETRFPGRRKYCSIVCRGRFQRLKAALAA